MKKLDDAPVFQWVLQTTTDDMTESATRLDKEDSGTSTQEIQEDAIRKIGELIEALRKERTKPGTGGGGRWKWRRESSPGSAPGGTEDAQDYAARR